MLRTQVITGNLLNVVGKLFCKILDNRLVVRLESESMRVRQDLMGTGVVLITFLV